MPYLAAVCASISIHALREEGDRTSVAPTRGVYDFYPRPPRGGRRGSTGRSLWAKTFLSTPSARRATHLNVIRKSLFAISIHALREEGDFLPCSVCCCLCHFYPRPPRGGRRQQKNKDSFISVFLSTPSARRATRRKIRHGLRHGNFYPRPPRGGRLWLYGRSEDMTIFLSTPSARRATSRPARGTFRQTISIHALREEGDSPQCRRPAMA